MSDTPTPTSSDNCSERVLLRLRLWRERSPALLEDLDNFLTRKEPPSEDLSSGPPISFSL